MTLGVLGGLGPGATVHFFDRLIKKTPAESDQEHIETLVFNDPTVPDRTAAILNSGPSPKSQLVENAITLDNAACDAIVINSNTTHYYYDAIAAAVDAEVPHLMQLVSERLKKRDFSSVGVLTTEPAAEIGLYDDVAETVVYPDEIDLLMDAMYLYKAGEIEPAKQKFLDGVATVPNHVDCYVVGCTDFSALSVTLNKETVDALEVLVDWCVVRYHAF